MAVIPAGVIGLSKSEQAARRQGQNSQNLAQTANIIQQNKQMKQQQKQFEVVNTMNLIQEAASKTPGGLLRVIQTEGSKGDGAIHDLFTKLGITDDGINKFFKTYEGLPPLPEDVLQNNISIQLRSLQEGAGERAFSQTLDDSRNLFTRGKEPFVQVQDTLRQDFKPEPQQQQQQQQPSSQTQATSTTTQTTTQPQSTQPEQPEDPTWLTRTRNPAQITFDAETKEVVDSYTPFKEPYVSDSAKVRIKHYLDKTSQTPANELGDKYFKLLEQEGFNGIIMEALAKDTSDATIQTLFENNIKASEDTIEVAKDIVRRYVHTQSTGRDPDLDKTLNQAVDTALYLDYENPDGSTRRESTGANIDVDKVKQIVSKTLGVTLKGVGAETITSTSTSTSTSAKDITSSIVNTEAIKPEISDAAKEGIVDRLSGTINRIQSSTPGSKEYEDATKTLGTQTKKLLTWVDYEKAEEDPALRQQIQANADRVFSDPNLLGQMAAAMPERAAVFMSLAEQRKLEKQYQDPNSPASIKANLELQKMLVELEKMGIDKDKALVGLQKAGVDLGIAQVELQKAMFATANAPKLTQEDINMLKYIADEEARLKEELGPKLVGDDQSFKNLAKIKSDLLNERFGTTKFDWSTFDPGFFSILPGGLSPGAKLLTQPLENFSSNVMEMSDEEKALADSYGF